MCILYDAFLPKFATENQQLFTQMSSMTDELKQIEGKVIEISKLQEVFAEKVLSQVIVMITA